jgi:predicted ATPase/class 3 adenylate cyclase
VSETLTARRSLPTGTVTFLFTDIEGSTERWERHREAMRAAVQRHNEILKAAIEEHSGHVFKTVGDAFCASFHNVADAIATALDTQVSLAKENWKAVDGLRVRMAIHTGHTDERDGDYFGPAVNRVARLLAIGHGGQVLVSGASADLAQGELPPRAALRDLGAHRLKDLTHPEQVYQLVAPDLPAEFPPLRSLEGLPNNLPLQLTSFVGRELEILTVTELLAKQRLVTLVGAGGVGKTRLALQVGAELLDHYEDGVWLVELAPIADPALVPSAVASIFHVLDAPNRTITEAIIHALKSRRALIVFDNCEHVVEPAARVIDAILRNCPHVRIIATTRQGLGIAGEAVHRVASLAVPEPSRELTAEEAARYGAVALFVERAIAATESFRLTNENAPIVARLCQRLDGIALAIELAAPRLKVLSLEQLDAKLSERFRILTGGSRTALPRQQTMRALVDWSYDLLTDDEKTLFRRVAVFSGGWSLDAASSICSDEEIEEWAVLDLLQSLVDKSMVVAKLSGSEQRYRLLESTRQYAHELLEKSGELEPMQVKHAKWFLEFSNRAEVVRNTSPTKTWLATIEPENDNLRAALDWALGEKRDIELGCALAADLTNYWRVSANEAEGKARIEAALAVSGQLVSKETVAHLWLGRCRMVSTAAVAWSSLREMAKKAYELNRDLGDERGMEVALTTIAETHLRQFEHVEAKRLLDEALVLAERGGNRNRIGAVKSTMARNLHFAGRTDEAREIYAEVLNIARALGNDRLRITVIGNLAEIEFQQGDAARALELGREAIAIASHENYIGLNNVAAYLIHLDQVDEGRSMARRALQVARDAQVSAHVGVSIQNLARVARKNSDARLAARLLGYCAAAFKRTGLDLEPTEQRGHDALMQELSQALSADELARLLNEGATLSEDQAVEEALRV